MGLDGVQLVMEVEEHFGITIQETTAERIRTIGDLIALIHNRLTRSRESHCAYLAAFLTLRSVVRQVTGNDALRFRPSYSIENTLTPTQRRVLWKRLAEILGAFPLGLRRPPLLRNLVLSAALIVLFGAVWLATLVDLAILPVTVAIALIIIYGLHFGTIGYRISPPAGWSTFGEVTRKIVGISMATKRLNIRTEEEILAELRPIIVDVLGVNAKEIVPTARFIEDLGIG